MIFISLKSGKRWLEVNVPSGVIKMTASPILINNACS